MRIGKVFRCLSNKRAMSKLVTTCSDCNDKNKSTSGLPEKTGKDDLPACAHIFMHTNWVPIRHFDPMLETLFATPVFDTISYHYIRSDEEMIRTLRSISAEIPACQSMLVLTQLHLDNKAVEKELKDALNELTSAEHQAKVTLIALDRTGKIQNTYLATVSSHPASSLFRFTQMAAPLPSRPGQTLQVYLSPQSSPQTIYMARLLKDQHNAFSYKKVECFVLPEGEPFRESDDGESAALLLLTDVEDINRQIADKACDWNKNKQGRHVHTFVTVPLDDKQREYYADCTLNAGDTKLLRHQLRRELTHHVHDKIASRKISPEQFTLSLKKKNTRVVIHDSKSPKLSRETRDKEQRTMFEQHTKDFFQSCTP